jgi:hypothetical protein
VHLVWPTVVSQPRPHKAVFYASSRDGATFTARMRVTAVDRNVAHPQIAVARDGRVAVLWDEIVDGQRRVLLGGVGEDGITGPMTVSADRTASYPVAAFTGSGLVVAWTEGAPESSQIAVRFVGGSGG